MDSNRRPENMERITTRALADRFIAEQVAEIQATVGNKKVLLALSGGVDSSVVAALLIKAIGKQLVCVHVNHGLMRKGESEQVIEVFRNGLDANLVYVDATDRFLDLLAGVSEPEKKRKIIGGEFIKVFDEEAAKLDGAGEFQIFLRICVPMSKTIIYSVAILIFIDYWNMVEQPLVLMSDSAMHPLSVFLSQINSGDAALAFAVASIYMIVPLLTFLYSEDYIVEGVAYAGGVKG